jgi:hypothetical protein
LTDKVNVAENQTDDGSPTKEKNSLDGDDDDEIISNQTMKALHARLFHEDIHDILDPGEPVEPDDLYEPKYVDIARLEGAGSFGELALIDGKPRMATIKCTERTHFLTIHHEDYEKAKERIKLAKRDEKVNFMKQ